MGNITIDENLKKQIEKLLKDGYKKTKFQNLKGFVDNATSALLKEELKKNMKKEISNKILEQSGLNFSNLLNSIYVTKKKTPVSKNLPIQDQVDKHLENLGLKDVRKKFTKDTYYGLVTGYSWFNLSAKNGAQFSPLNYLIDELQKINAEDIPKLRSMKRRLTYLISLRDEIKYIFLRYDFKKLPMLQDWLLNKFERYATLVAELSLFIIEYYNVKINNLSIDKSIRFEDMIDYIYDIDKFFQYLNSTVEGFVIINIRNHIVHSDGFDLKSMSDDFLIKIPEIDIKLKFRIFKTYAEDVLKLFFNGKKRTGEDIIINDPRFPYLTLKYKVTKKGTIDYYKTKIKVDISLKEYIKLAENFIFILTRTLLQKMLSQQSSKEISFTNNS